MMRRLSALLLALILAGGLSLAPASAQDDATPTAGGGEETILATADGDQIAAITVESVTDPFEDFDEFSEPEAGTRFVAVEVTVENLDEDDDTFTVDPFPFQLADANGFVYSYAFVSRDDDAEPEDLQSVDLEPGDSTTGMVFFAVPEDAELGFLYYTTSLEDGQVLLTLVRFGEDEDAEAADAGDTTPAGDDAATPATDDDDDATPTAEADDATPTAEDDATPAASGDIACDDLQAYADDLTSRLDRVGEVREELTALAADLQQNPPTTPAALEEIVDQITGYADEFEDLAAEQAEADVPAGAEDLNETAVTMFETYADGFQQLADGVAELDEEALAEDGPALATLRDADDLSDDVTDGLDTAAEECELAVA